MGQKLENLSCENCTARLCSIFADLNDKEIAILSQYKCGKMVKRGQNIFLGGTVPAGIYCINSGKVKIAKIDSYGKEQIVRMAKDGDVLGYRSLISGETYGAFATAIEDCKICLIPKDVFFNLMETNPSLPIRLMQLMSQDLKNAEKLLSSMSQKPVRERVAEVLLILREFYGVKEDGGTIDISLKREDLANIVGTAPETVIRFLSEFKKDKIIDLKRREISISDHTALVRIANIYD